MKLRDNLPELEGETTWLNSEPIKKADLLGSKPTLIHFWSVSCSLCKETMANINAFRDEYKDVLNVIAVHTPDSEKDLDVNQVKEVAEKYNITQPIMVDHAHKLTKAFNNQYVPAYYVFDKEGKLRHFQSGRSGMIMLRKRVNRILRQHRT